jgi:hypothetical protein
MFILDPDFFPSRIPDPSTRRGWEEKLVGLPFFSQLFRETENYLIFEQAQKKI